MDNNFKCPSCGGELQASENGFFVCQACGKAFRRAEKKPQASEQPAAAQQPVPPVQQPAEQNAAASQPAAPAPHAAYAQPAAPVYAAYGAPQPAYQGAGAAAQPTTPAEVYTPARKGYVKGRWWVSRLSMGLLMLLISAIVTGLCFGVVGDAVMSAISGIIGLGACAFATAILAMALISRNNEVSVGAFVGMSIANCALTLISVICATIPLATSTSAALVIVPVVLVAFFEAIGVISMTQACDLWNASTLGKMTFGKKSFSTRNEELNSYENRRSWLSLFLPVVYGVFALVIALVIVFGSSSVTDPLRKADEVHLGMGIYAVNDIVGHEAERGDDNDIDSATYVWYDAEYAALVDDAKSLFNKLKNCGDAEEALSLMQQIVDIEEEKAGRAYTMFTVDFENNKAVRISLVNKFPEDGDLTFEKKVEKNDCEYTASTNRKDDEGDGFYLEIKRAWSYGSWEKYYSEAIIADMEYDEVSGRYTVTCPITFDSENMVNYTLTATETEWASVYGFTDIAEYYATYFAQA